MTRRGGARSAAAALLLAATLGALALLWYQAARSDVAPYLAREGPAEWIVYPQAPSLDVRGRVELVAVFSRAFELSARPEHARLLVRMHRHGTLSINGREVPFADSKGEHWKAAREGDVADWLRPGRNDVQVWVRAEAGPPALWLSLDAGGVKVTSDGSWSASLMGAEEAPARLAREPMSRWSRGARDPAELDAENPRPLAALRARAPAIAALFALGGIVAAGVAYALRSATRLTNRFAFGAWLAAAAVWVAMFANNRTLHGAWGFDATGHYDYLTVVLRGHLPLADEGFQMYQPPLYYLMGAALLKLAGYSALDADAAQLLRWLGCAAGLLQLGFLLLALRELLPERPGLVLAAFAFGACLPVQIYLAHYPTNENWVAALSSGALWWTIRMLRRERSRLWEHAVLGLFLGLALLAKFSALVPLALCTLVLLGQRLLAGRRSARELVGGLAVTLAVVLAVSGWHYARVAVHFGGNPFVGNWDAASGYLWWQDPGYRVFEDFARFGLALERPLHSAVAGVPDALYSTLWGDGMIGGSGYSHVTPPWRIELMAAGYLVALGPCLALLLGGVLAGVDFARRPRAERLLSLFVLGATLFLLLSLTLRLPYYAQAKAFYGLATLVPLAFCFALGFDALALRARFLAPVGVAWLAGWAALSLATFFAPAERLSEDPNRLVTRRDPGGYVAYANLALARGQRDEAIDALRKAIALEPDQARVGSALVKLLRDAHRSDEALRAARAALRVNPYDPALHFVTSELWEEQRAPRRAAFHLDAAKRLARLARSKAAAPAP
jgi:tetratricopeptide (TPR) repeat protein